MQKKINLIIIIIFVSAALSIGLYSEKQKSYTIKAKTPEELLYKGSSYNWDVELKINEGKDTELNIKYIGIGEPPKLINAEYKLNDYSSSGVMEFGKTLSGYHSKGSARKITGIKKEILQIVIKWENNKENIKIQKISK